MIHSFVKGQLLKLLPVCILLILIPILLMNEQVGTAKMGGFILVIYMSILVMKWRNDMIKEYVRRKRVRISTNERFWLERNVKAYQLASKVERLIFEDQIGLIIANVVLKDENNDIADKDGYLLLASFLFLEHGNQDWNTWNGKEFKIDFSDGNTQNESLQSLEEIKKRLTSI
jgi:hypothetical protein